MQVLSVRTRGEGVCVGCVAHLRRLGDQLLVHLETEPLVRQARCAPCSWRWIWTDDGKDILAPAHGGKYLSIIRARMKQKGRRLAHVRVVAYLAASSLQDTQRKSEREELGNGLYSAEERAHM